MNRRSELGRGALGCLISLAVVVIIGMIAYQAIPKRIAVAEMQDYCVNQAESASLPGYDNEAITKHLVEKAHELNLPIPPEAIEVSRGGSEVHIRVKYTIKLNFPLYTYVWDVDHDISRPLF